MESWVHRDPALYLQESRAQNGPEEPGKLNLTDFVLICASCSFPLSSLSVIADFVKLWFCLFSFLSMLLTSHSAVFKVCWYDICRIQRT